MFDVEMILFLSFTVFNGPLSKSVLCVCIGPCAETLAY